MHTVKGDQKLGTGLFGVFLQDARQHASVSSMAVLAVALTAYCFPIICVFNLIYVQRGDILSCKTIWVPLWEVYYWKNLLEMWVFR